MADDQTQTMTARHSDALSGLAAALHTQVVLGRLNAAPAHANVYARNFSDLDEASQERWRKHASDLMRALGLVAVDPELVDAYRKAKESDDAARAEDDQQHRYAVDEMPETMLDRTNYATSIAEKVLAQIGGEPDAGT